MSVTRKMGDKFKIGDYVFAKLRGYPAWPATITRRIPGKSENYDVLFYGTFETGRVSGGSIYPYNENTKSELGNVRGKGGSFQLAMEQIESRAGIGELDQVTVEATTTKPIVTTGMTEVPPVLQKSGEVSLQEVAVQLSNVTINDGAILITPATPQAPTTPQLQSTRRSSRKGKPRKRFADEQPPVTARSEPGSILGVPQLLVPQEERPKLTAKRVTAKRRPRKNSLLGLTPPKVTLPAPKLLRSIPPLRSMPAHVVQAMTSASAFLNPTEVNHEPLKISTGDTGRGISIMEENLDLESKDAYGEDRMKNTVGGDPYNFVDDLEIEEGSSGLPAKRRKLSKKGRLLSKSSTSVKETGSQDPMKLEELQRKLVQLRMEGEIVDIVGDLVGTLGEKQAMCDEALEHLTNLGNRTDVNVLALTKNPEVLQVILKVQHFHGNSLHLANLNSAQVEDFHTKAKMIREKAFFISEKFKLLFLSYNMEQGFRSEVIDDELNVKLYDDAVTVRGVQESENMNDEQADIMGNDFGEAKLDGEAVTVRGLLEGENMDNEQADICNELGGVKPDDAVTIKGVLGSDNMDDEQADVMGNELGEVKHDDDGVTLEGVQGSENLRDEQADISN